MSLIEPAPAWHEHLNTKKLSVASRPEFQHLSHRANIDQYLYWDKFKHICKLDGMTAEEAWAYIRFQRNSNLRRIPLKDIRGRSFGYWVSDGLLKGLHEFEFKSGEMLLNNPEVPPEEKERFLISALMEEAIASSQLEGASTTREIAKEMLRSGRKPKDHAEQMIFNNFNTIKKIKEVSDQPLSVDILNRLQISMTENTIEPAALGRFRTADEQIRVVDNATGEELHLPPPAGELSKRVQLMCDYANAEDGYGFVHPIVKAMILHFWLAYDHPYVDGNGRTARALFYWYMLRKKYWSAEFISISRIIKQAPAKYKYAYLYSEHDEQDITYFLYFHLDSLCKALQDLKEYVSRKTREIREAASSLAKFPDINYRQSKLLYHALTHRGMIYQIDIHRNTWGITYETARTDLLGLVARGLLIKNKKGRAYYFLPVADLQKRLKISK